MSLEYILLGMLDKPATGYELKNKFEHGTRYFWAAEFSQIYPTLNRLEERGLLTSRMQPSDKGPERRVYKRTAKGKQEFLAWLRSGPAMGTERFAYIGQLIYMAQLDDLAATRDFLEHLRDELAGRADVLRSTQRTLQALTGFPASLNEDDFHAYLALSIGVESIAGRMRGCEACLKLVQKRLQREASHV